MAPWSGRPTGPMPGQSVHVVMVDDEGARVYPDRCEVVDRYSAGRLVYLVVAPEGGAPRFRVAASRAFPSAEAATAFASSVKATRDEARAARMAEDEDTEPQSETDDTMDDSADHEEHR